MGVAFLHVVGALALTLGIWYGQFLLAERQGKRVKTRFRLDAALALGVPVSALDGVEVESRLIQYVAQRYQSELFRNRVSDLCGSLNAALGWLQLTVLVVATGVVAWMLIGGGSEKAMGMWFVPAVAMFFGAVSLSLTLICYTLTGRYPGEAEKMRGVISGAIE
jgi:hypothetical protein